MEKIRAELRRKAAKQRNALDPEYRKSASERILQVLRKLPTYEWTQRIFLFSGFGSEPDTAGWAEAFRKDGKATYYPRTQKGGIMEFYRVESFSELEPGAYGILEPEASCEQGCPAAGDWVLTPGLLFDCAGYRIGYGGGFYDRYMEKHPKAVYIGVAYRSQRVAALSPGPWDQRVSLLVTDALEEEEIK